MDVEFTKADSWKVAKPYEPYKPEDSTLPHMITVARESDQEDFVFIVSPMQYKDVQLVRLMTTCMFQDRLYH